MYYSFMACQDHNCDQTASITIARVVLLLRRICIIKSSIQVYQQPEYCAHTWFVPMPERLFLV